MKKQTFGVIVTTRGFFPSHLVKTAREKITGLLDSMGHDYVMVGESDTEYGAIVTYEEAKVCADLFKKNSDIIDGIIVILPNFGEELGVAEAIQLSGLDVPILIQACDDDWDKMDMNNRRDAFCGKLSLCNNLYQRNIKYSLTELHTCKIDSEEFKKDLQKFAGVCRVVNGLKGSRIAMLGARPIAFNTVRFSEKILQKHRIAVQTVDFSEIIFKAMSYDDQEKIAAKMEEIKGYGNIPDFINNELIERQAKLCIVLEETVDALDCDA
ncbi:MAG: hypothetical protein K0S04_2912, partial [Herbinix sp.]|nr:hypothetical protein [Herbinix sp.]